MYRCLIIADDLTGANATISLLKNLKITTLLDLLCHSLSQVLSSQVHLHSNMVRFIMYKIIYISCLIVIFTLQYG